MLSCGYTVLVSVWTSALTRAFVGGGGRKFGYIVRRIVAALSSLALKFYRLTRVSVSASMSVSVCLCFRACVCVPGSVHGVSAECAEMTVLLVAITSAHLSRSLLVVLRFPFGRVQGVCRRDVVGVPDETGRNGGVQIGGDQGHEGRSEEGAGVYHAGTTILL